MKNKIIISLPVLATILCAAVSTTTAAYGQDWLIGPPDIPPEEQEYLQEQRRLLQELQQQYEQEQQAQQQQALPTPTTTSTTTTTTTATPTVPTDYIEVRSALFGAVISYPPDWELQPPYNSVRGYSLLHVFAPEGGDEGEFTADRPNFNVEVSEERGAMSQSSARAYLEERAFELMTVHDQFEVIESVPTTLQGQPGWMIKYTFTGMIDGTEMTHTQAMGGVAGRTYLLTYSSSTDLYDEYLPAVQNMINSFRVE
jgi:hypothetical protein